MLDRIPILSVGTLALAVALAAPSAVQAQTDDIRTVSLEMYLDLESVSSPQISPDGSQVVYTRGWVDKMNDSRESSVWIMNADGSRNRFLVDGSGPIWAPDGSRIAYTATGDPEGSQIFVRWMDDEGATSQITRLESSPSGIRWSPDGTRVSFSMNVDAEPAFMVNPPGRPSGATWVDAPRVVTRADYRQDRVGFVDGAWRHIFVVPAEGGTARQLTDGDWNHSTGEWTPDGEELLFSSLRTEDAELAWRESEVYSVDVESGAIRTLTSRVGQDFSPLPSPTGDLIAYRGADFHTDTYRNASIYVMNRDVRRLRSTDQRHDVGPRRQRSVSDRQFRGRSQPALCLGRWRCTRAVHWRSHVRTQLVHGGR